VKVIVLALAFALKAEHCSSPTPPSPVTVPPTLIIETVDMATERTRGVSIRSTEKSVLCSRAIAYKLKYLLYKYMYSKVSSQMLDGGSIQPHIVLINIISFFTAIQ
jgi:hypothetical protein